MKKPDLNNDPQLLKIKTKDDEIKESRCRSQKHDHENILKSLETENDYYKKPKSLNKKKILLNTTEILIGSASTISSTTLSKLNPGGWYYHIV